MFSNWQTGNTKMETLWQFLFVSFHNTRINYYNLNPFVNVPHDMMTSSNRQSSAHL